MPGGGDVQPVFPDSLHHRRPPTSCRPGTKLERMAVCPTGRNRSVGVSAKNPGLPLEGRKG